MKAPYKVTRKMVGFGALAEFFWAYTIPTYPSVWFTGASYLSGIGLTSIGVAVWIQNHQEALDEHIGH